MKAFLLALIAVFIVLNALDYFSTALVLSKGRGSEGNPIMKAVMKVLGKYWWLAKLPILGFCYGAYHGLIPQHAVVTFIVLDALFTWVVWHNYKIAWRQG